MNARAVLLIAVTSLTAATAHADDDRVLTVAVGGDVMFGRYLASGYRAHGGDAPFGIHAETLRGADVAFVNLETGVCARGRTQSAFPLLWAPVGRLDALVDAGIDVVSVANNHALDCANDGVAHTATALRQRGIAAAGLAPEGVVAVGDVLFVGATAHRPPYRCGGECVRATSHEDRTLAETVANLRRSHPEKLVLVSLHWGLERSSVPAAWQRRFAHALIDAGAAAVVGHGPHVPQPAELYRGAPVFYSLGNLVFDDRSPAAEPVPPKLLRFRYTDGAWTLDPAAAERFAAARDAW